MEADKRAKGLPSRKQITFDLNDNKLKSIYPRSKVTLNPKYYKKAWKDIARFMERNGFEHRQCSVYASQKEMTGMDVNALIMAMAIRMPWICKCLDAIDVTNIGEQHDLIPFIRGIEIEFEHGRAEWAVRLE